MPDKYLALRGLTGNPLLDEAAVQIKSKLIYDLLTERDALRDALSKLNSQLADNGLQSGTTYGPLCHQAAVALSQ